MIFLGTASAAGFPNPFCSCEDCRKARSSQDDREIRARSSFLLDERNLIDFSADTLYAANRFRKSLENVRNIFLTHCHEDHFDYWNMEFFNMAADSHPPVHLYLSRKAAEGLQQVIESLRHLPYPRMTHQFLNMEKVFYLHPMDFYQTVEVDGMQVTPMKGRHEGFFNDENSANYVLERPEGNLMYACDTGRFFEETYEWLAGHKLDILVIEGTFGLRETAMDSGHMNFYAVCDTLERLYRMQVLDKKSRVYVTHLSPKGKMTHMEYEKRLQDRFGPSVFVAYDGLEISAE
ncbi:MAG: MBL fold metallo-hydrolase [Candidatus Merdivicinus sp.]|jgi:phosphoribosyl 1,2-cyclic phosphate phosphodiesterase